MNHVWYLLCKYLVKTTANSSNNVSTLKNKTKQQLLESMS